MSVFGDLKRIFFGAKSVAKHKGGQAVDTVKETAGDLADKAGDALDGLGDKISEGAGTAYEKASDASEKAGDWLNDQWSKINTQEGAPEDEVELNLADDELVPDPHAPSDRGPIDFEEGLAPDPSAPKEPSAFSKVADSALDSAAKAGIKAKDTAERLGQKAMEKGDELLSKAAEKGAELKGKFDEMVDKASEKAEAEAARDAAEKARVEAEIEAAKDKSFGGDADTRDTSESTLTGSDSFFDRASRWADGDYHNESDKNVRIEEDPNYKKPQKGGDIQGFDDKDGDGDALIDDADVVEE